MTAKTKQDIFSDHSCDDLMLLHVRKHNIAIDRRKARIYDKRLLSAMNCLFWREYEHSY